MALRFVRPNVRRLDLGGGGDWIDIKQELTAGEARSLLREAHTRQADGTLVLDPANASMARLLAYIVDWSLTDDHGKRVAVTTEAIDSLDVPSYTALVTAINDHENSRPTDAATPPAA